MATLERAIEIAREAHEGESRRDGQPYVMHPIRVMGALAMADYGEMLQIVAVLHDVVEDNPSWTLERLACEGFNDEIIETLSVLTREKSDDPDQYTRYIDRIAEHTLAQIVKIFDIFDNVLDHPTSEQVEKYQRALSRLVIESLLDDEALFLKSA